MKRLIPLFFVFLLAGCSGEIVEKMSFRLTMEYQLKEKRGDENQACHDAVVEQIDACMEQSDWKRYVDNSEDADELERFIFAFFPCFEDADGNAYFGL